MTIKLHQWYKHETIHLYIKPVEKLELFDHVKQKDKKTVYYRCECDNGKWTYTEHFTKTYIQDRFEKVVDNQLELL